MLADRRPALLWPLPNTCPEGSRRDRLGGRGAVGVGPFAVGGLDGWRTADGARLADIEGEGDERDDAATPLVCMPGGTGRLILVATGAGPAGAAAATVGAMDRVSCRPGAASPK